MPDTPSITINKRFNYRGLPEVWSNTYHFSGTQPSSPAAWKTLADAIWAAESAFLPKYVEYVGFLGYEAGNNHAVEIRDFVADGTARPVGLIDVTSPSQAGDTAVWVRWRLPTRNSRGKWNYLRKYFHGIVGQGDAIASGPKAGLEAYRVKMTDGTLPGGAKICGDQGEVAGVSKVADFIGFRQLKRTGKRPSL